MLFAANEASIPRSDFQPSFRYLSACRPWADGARYRQPNSEHVRPERADLFQWVSSTLAALTVGGLVVGLTSAFVHPGRLKDQTTLTAHLILDRKVSVKLLIELQMPICIRFAKRTLWHVDPGQFLYCLSHTKESTNSAEYFAARPSVNVTSRSMNAIRSPCSAPGFLKRTIYCLLEIVSDSTTWPASASRNR